MTLSGIVTDSSDVQYSNASEPILLTLFGITTCVIPLLEKACLPILVTVSGIYTVKVSDIDLDIKTDYKISDENKYIYTGLDTNESTILNNITINREYTYYKC